MSAKQFDKLKHWKQQALIMFLLEGKNYMSIHKSLGVPYDTVYGALRKLCTQFTAEQVQRYKRLPTIFVIGDTQCKPSVDLEYMRWIGNYIAHKKPDIIVHIGDHYDFESLSYYDKGKKAAEGRRYSEDIIAGNAGLALLELEISKVKGYNPRKVFTVGNHEHRETRYAEDNPEMHGTMDGHTKAFTEAGWEVYPFLQPVNIHGINFQHFVANPMTGRPMGGSALNILKNCGSSFVMGHRQVLDMAVKPTLGGGHQLGIVVGACYQHDEGYKGYQGNNHFRGCVLLTEVKDGYALPNPVSLEHMQKVYEVSR